ncbi:hypothetical protein C8Q70DRAFT_456658 [Cubamyces menziesii]|nr:hypothetical protein C8Q70DRAFT_456658 [Cubamyces menziesii]
MTFARLPSPRLPRALILSQCLVRTQDAVHVLRHSATATTGMVHTCVYPDRPTIWRATRWTSPMKTTRGSCTGTSIRPAAMCAMHFKKHAGSDVNLHEDGASRRAVEEARLRVVCVQMTQEGACLIDIPESGTPLVLRFPRPRSSSGEPVSGQQ